MSFELPPPPIAKMRRRTFQTMILSEDGDSRFEARFLRQSVFYSPDGTVLFTVNDPDPIVFHAHKKTRSYLIRSGLFVFTPWTLLWGIQ